MSDQQIIDRSDLRKYRTELPNLYDDAGLDPYEFRLLAHYKRVGTCWESLSTTATKCCMSVAQVSIKRRALADKGWIELDDQKPHGVIIAVVDKWSENFTRYSGREAPRRKLIAPKPQPPAKPWTLSDFEQAKSFGLRSEVCVFCGGESQVLDHWMPKSRGGTDDESNLVASCSVCNAAKGAMTGQEFVSLLLQRGWMQPSPGESGPHQVKAALTTRKKPSPGEVKNQPIKNQPVKNHHHGAPPAPSARWDRPQIKLLKQIAGLMVPDGLIDELTDVLGPEPDAAKLRACYREWHSRGKASQGWGWALEWYRDGIPPRITNGGQHDGQGARRGARSAGGVEIGRKPATFKIPPAR